MPGDESGIARLLDEEAGVPAQDIGPKQILDRVEDPGMADHVVDPGKQHVAAMAHLALDRATGPRLIVLELAAKFGDLALAQHIDRKMVAALAIGLDLTFAQALRHRSPPAFSFLASSKSDPVNGSCQSRRAFHRPSHLVRTPVTVGLQIAHAATRHSWA